MAEQWHERRRRQPRHHRNDRDAGRRRTRH
jgi:hypothetical protein